MHWIHIIANCSIYATRIALPDFTEGARYSSMDVAGKSSRPSRVVANPPIRRVFFASESATVTVPLAGRCTGGEGWPCAIRRWHLLQPRSAGQYCATGWLLELWLWFAHVAPYDFWPGHALGFRFRSDFLRNCGFLDGPGQRAGGGSPFCYRFGVGAINGPLSFG